ncbi:PEP-CTERM sorting domain-containing protein [Roseateles sp. BYS180W]|uniref:PEP-CTERM sorting domain-containing protein n=1 Tax=Roseateles rivi TaxID=3299028 RepID=A0ABW7FQP7_9BURK
MRHPLCAAALALAPLLAQAYTLDFGQGPNAPTLCATNADGSGSASVCANGSWVNQSYGDMAGLVDVSYGQPLTPNTSLRWWDQRYNNLYGVLWADGGDGPQSYARIDMRALGGGLRLTNFTLGAYSETSRSTQVDVFDLGSNALLYHYEGMVGDATTNTATVFNVDLSSSTGLRLEWRNSAYNVGLDNVVLQAVPEPSSLALMLGGLAGVLPLVRRRRQASSARPAA